MTVAAFAAHGAALVLVSPQTVENNRAIAEVKNLCVPILSDPGNAVAARYGIRFALSTEMRALYLKFGIDLPRYNGDDDWTLPMPTRLVIDRQGIVRHVETNPDHTVRPEPEETLRIVQSLD